MNNLVRAIVGCGAVLGLAGCGAGVDAAGSGGPALADGVGGSAEPAAVNERGFIVKQLGEVACVGGAGQDCAGGASFVIDRVEVDPRCGEFSAPPESGHTLLLHVRVATGADADIADRVAGIINPFSFVEIGRDGVTRESGFGMCADPSADQLPNRFGPNQQYQGVIDIEVPEASGVLALQLMFADEDGERGWEWTYPV